MLAGLVFVLLFAGACDRRAAGEQGDLSPETGATTPAPQDTPPSDPASGTAPPPAPPATTPPPQQEPPPPVE
jgi:hypothetical protein